MSELGGDDVFHCHGSGGRSDKLQVLGRQVLEMAALSVEGSVWLHAQKYRAMCTSITAGAHFVKKHLWYGKLKAADSTFLVVYLHNCVGYAVGSPKCCRDAKTWLYPLLQHGSAWDWVREGECPACVCLAQIWPLSQGQ
eukprot:GEMP01120234.1.p1 GENE.GEMP01120234.1~~GEMP01120234.1.p1  ORF type:complete len:139 (+),score=18.20 GEMP01120234.1:192-608(+)